MPKSAAARSTHPGRWGHPDVRTASREEKRLRIKIPRRRHLSGLGRENPILFHLSRGLYSPSYKRGQLQELYQHTQQRDSGKNLSWGALPLPPPPQDHYPFHGWPPLADSSPRRSTWGCGGEPGSHIQPVSVQAARRGPLLRTGLPEGPESP